VPALEQVVTHGEGVVVDALAAALADVARRRLAQGLAMVGTLGEPVRPFVESLLAAERYGAPVVPALERAAAEARSHRRRRARKRHGGHPSPCCSRSCCAPSRARTAHRGPLSLGPCRLRPDGGPRRSPNSVGPERFAPSSARDPSVAALPSSVARRVAGTHPEVLSCPR
jgi:hypothetical protein